MMNIVFRLVVFILFLTTTSIVTMAADIPKCLKGVKESLSDPNSRLSGWDFSNMSAPGGVCNFDGVICWNPLENRVMDLRLNSMGLSGQLPSALRFCSETTGLYLSGNSLSGAIPAELCTWLPYLATLDLSRNSFSGPIPPELANCKFLNTLLLNGNQLSGSIPSQLVGLSRLTHFSVADNSLSGSIPAGLDKFPADSFEGNSLLCGAPVGKCGGLSNTSLIIIILAGVFGAMASVLVAYLIWRWCFAHPIPSSRRNWATGDGQIESDAQWVAKLKPHRLVQVTFFHKPINKVKLANLLAATGGFDSSKIIAINRSGTTYKAMLSDGSVLAVKRIRGCDLSDTHFHSEMSWLGKLRHPNLVPLLGFCDVGDEKLLVYKHMTNGSVSSILHGGSGHLLDWRERLKIGIGATRGLAWLHHGVQPPVIHQNISSNNILLDEDNESRITDFGLAKLVSKLNPGSNFTAFQDGDLGETGYVAPEYSSTMMSSLKGDVYAIGVVLLELVTGRKALDVVDTGEGGGGFRGNLVDWINHLSDTFRLGDAVDNSILGKGHDDDVMQFLRIAAGCVASRPRERCSMYQVYEQLKPIGETHELSENLDDEFPLLFGKGET